VTVSLIEGNILLDICYRECSHDCHNLNVPFRCIPVQHFVVHVAANLNNWDRNCRSGNTSWRLRSSVDQSEKMESCKRYVLDVWV